MVRWSLLSMAFAGLVLLSGCTDFHPAGQNQLVVRGIDVSAPVVGSGSMLLVANLTLDNLAAASGPLHLVGKAYDVGTGLLVNTTQLDLAAIDADQTRSVALTFDVPRAAAYRLEIGVHQGGQLVQVAQVTAGNLDHLEPTTHDAGLRVAGIDVQVLSTAGNKSTVLATSYLTNEGRVSSRPLSLQLKAREVSTSILAAQVWASVGVVGPDETRAFNATIVLPAGYNYDLEAILWDGAIVVERGTGHVQFAPRSTVAPGQSVVVSTPNLQDFVRGAESNAPSSGKSNTPAPGLVALLAVLAVTLVLARRSLR